MVIIDTMHGCYPASAVVEVILLYVGLLCGGRSALTWSGVHRMHQEYAETSQDPHSLKNHSRGM